MNLKMGAPAAADAGNPWAGMTVAELEAAADQLRASAESVAAAAAALPATPAPVAPAAIVPAPAPAPVVPAADETAAAAYARGQAEERARVKGILTHAEAQGRQRQAQVIALGTSMSVDEAATLLKAMPLETAPAAAQVPHLAARSSFYNAVAANGGNPQIAHQGETSPTGYKSTLAEQMKRQVANLKK